MPLYRFVAPATGSKAPTLHVSTTDLVLDAGAVVADLGGFPKNFQNGMSKAVQATTLRNNAPAFVFIDGAGAAWLDDNPSGSNVPGDMWRAGRVWRDQDSKLIVCRGDHAGQTVSYQAAGSPFSRRWVDDASSPGGFSAPSAPFQGFGTVTYQTTVVVSGGGTATLRVRNATSGLVTKVGTFSAPTSTPITIGTDSDLLEFMTSDAATKLRITIDSAVEKL